MRNWRTRIGESLAINGETWDDVESNTLADEEMDIVGGPFGSGFVAGKTFTLWTKNRVYFPVTYDGSEWCGSVSRNPDGKPTEQQGGG